MVFHKIQNDWEVLYSSPFLGKLKKVKYEVTVTVNLSENIFKNLFLGLFFFLKRHTTYIDPSGHLSFMIFFVAQTSITFFNC